MHHIWWIPLVIAYYVVYAWVSKHNSVDTTVWYASKWFWIIIGMGVFPGWAIVSRVTTNLIFDGFLYDLLMVLGFYGMLLFVGEAESFCMSQWIGFVLTLVGLFLLRP